MGASVDMKSQKGKRSSFSLSLRSVEEKERKSSLGNKEGCLDNWGWLTYRRDGKGLFSPRGEVSIDRM